MPNDVPSKNFTLGLTMAGAVSAGDYTAGVLDVLYRALELQAQRNADDELNVRLKAMSGTSAGGVCTAMSIPMLIEGMPDNYKENLLYRLWVKELDLIGSEDAPGLASATDLKKGEPFLSALNGEAIEFAAERLLTPVKWRGTPARFLSDELELFITSTNMNGVSHQVPFKAGDKASGHAMGEHAFVAHFSVKGLGTYPEKSAWLEYWKDAGFPLELATDPDKLPQSIGFYGGKLPDQAYGWSLLRRIGISTGAFPLGLAAKPIEVTGSHFGLPLDALDGHSYGGARPLDLGRSDLPLPQGLDVSMAQSAIEFVAVDGGVCNNEPFELARYCIRKGKRVGDEVEFEEDRISAEHADRAVIMIDPFPEGPEPAFHETVEPKDLAFGAILAGLKSTLVNQARFKPAELVTAMDVDNRSRFLIAPSRDHQGRKLHGGQALASGLMGGFGGFVDESLREHDFQLGRHNAWSFLKKYFNLAKQRDDFGVLAGSDDNPDGNANEAPIIRLSGALDTEIPEPVWPRLTKERIDQIVGAFYDRASDVVGHQGGSQLSGIVPNLVGIVAWAVKIKGAIKDFIRAQLGASLIARDQVEGLQRLSSDERATLSALYGAARNLHTVRGLTKALNEKAVEQSEFWDVQRVQAALQSLASLEDAEYGVWSGKRRGKRVYVTNAFRPKVFRRIPIVRGISSVVGGKVTIRD